MLKGGRFLRSCKNMSVVYDTNFIIFSKFISGDQVI